MKEQLLRKKAIEILEKEGWTTWFPKKVKYQETDAWGVFDLLCWWKNYLKFIQITTLSNIRAREKKVRGFLERNKLTIPLNTYVQIWGYNKKKKVWKIIIII